VKTDVFPSTIRLPNPSNLILVLLRILNTEEAVEIPALLENPGIPLPFRIQTVSLKVLDLKFKVLDEII
jgi:hypothetical protein